MNNAEKKIIANAIIWLVFGLILLAIYAVIVAFVLAITGSPFFAVVFATITGILMLLWFFYLYAKNT